MKRPMYPWAMIPLADFSSCGSPIEDVFYGEFQKTGSPDVVIERKRRVIVGRYTFCIDFLLRLDSRLIGIECDGKAFFRKQSAGWRDSQVVGAGLVDAIYRLRGRDIWYRIYDALDLIRAKEPSYFSERGHINIERLAARESEWRDELVCLEESFPFAIVRWYEPDESSPADDVDPPVNLPTVIFGTDLELV